MDIMGKAKRDILYEISYTITPMWPNSYVARTFGICMGKGLKNKNRQFK